MFTDQELDRESWLYNYDARMYDPVAARFVSADSVVPDWYDPQSLDRYAYARNNPVKYTDPSGHMLGLGIHSGTGHEFDDGVEFEGQVYDVGGVPTDQLDSLGSGAGFDFIYDDIDSYYGYGLDLYEDPTNLSAWAGLGISLGLDILPGDYLLKKIVPKRLLAGLKIGRKIGKHAQDFGLDASDPNARNFIRDLIDDIVNHYDEVKQGAWRGGVKDNLFYRKGNDVVVTKPDGTFVTILKDGVNNSFFRGAGGL